MVALNAVSQKCRYALRAIFELALRDTTDPVKIQDIALSQAIPPRFLEVILSELKHGGFVESRRGNDGGYMLSRPANDLTVGEVIGFLQGSSRSNARSDRQKLGLMGDYVFSKMWKNVNAAIADIYNSITFADLVEQELAKRKNYVPDYAI
ncbi:MAG: RrF2 family transcriptional regulator [Planctomycetota bacterium]|jgi:Rrf2 family protein